MRQLFIFCVIFFLCSNLFGQQQQLYTVSQVKEMAIFPGCSKLDATQKKEMNDCLSKQLSTLLAKEMKDIGEVLKQSEIYDAKAQIQFVISKEGILLGMEEMPGSNPVLAEAALLALEKISMELPPIRPALLKDGSPVNLQFQLPVNYKFDKPSKSEKLEYPVDEIVLFTLLTEEENLRYEVRLFQNKDIKIYEINTGKSSFLGKFLTLNEVENSEPYKSLIDPYRNLDKILVTDGFLENEFFEIYIYNLFNSKQKNPVFVEVVKVENKKRKVISKFEKEVEFNQSRFASLIYRE